MRPIAPLNRSSRPTALLAAGAIVLAGVALGACGVARTAFGPLQYDKTSPAAPAIASTSVQGLPYPSFLDVPSQPTDVRPTTAWSRSIFDVLAERRTMDAYQVTHPQTLYGGEAYAQESRAYATPPPETADGKKAAAGAPARATPPSPAP